MHSDPNSTGTPDAEAPLSCILITQNIGGLWCGVDDSAAVASKMEFWLRSLHVFLSAGLERRRGSGVSPAMFDVVVVHLQEVGGTALDVALVGLFDDALQRTRPEGSWCSGILMHSGEGASTYSATASVVFTSPRTTPVTSLLNFSTRRFELVQHVPTAWNRDRRFFLNSRRFYGATGRKGFAHIAIRLGTRVMHCCNVHLFHDADNVVAAQTSPSPYVAARSAALVEAVRAVQPFLGSDDALFVFGDFNTRLDACRLVRQRSDWDFRLEPKHVSADPQFWSSVSTLRPFDTEVSAVVDAVGRATGVELGELPFDHPPTYSLDVARRGAQGYSPARFPAWCDRVLINPPAMTFLGGWHTVPPEPRDRLTMGSYGSCAFEGMDHASVYLATA